VGKSESGESCGEKRRVPEELESSLLAIILVRTVANSGWIIWEVTVVLLLIISVSRAQVVRQTRIIIAVRSIESGMDAVIRLLVESAVWEVIRMRAIILRIRFAGFAS